jgi:hypothetical protein
MSLSPLLVLYKIQMFYFIREVTTFLTAKTFTKIFSKTSVSLLPQLGWERRNLFNQGVCRGSLETTIHFGDFSKASWKCCRISDCYVPRCDIKSVLLIILKFY